MKSTFDFRLIHPQGKIDQYVQALWSATVSSQSDSVSKPLFSDGACGVFINLTSPVQHDGNDYHQGLIYTPVKHQAEFINMSPGSRLVGFRFKPGVLTEAFASINEFVTNEQEIQYIQRANLPKRIQKLFSDLTLSFDLDHQIELLSDWLSEIIDPQNLPPEALSQLVDVLASGGGLSTIQQAIPLSLRQLERLFKNRMGMTPKYYQRLIRVRSAIERIKQNPEINLVELAIESGYSDQAHMTREFRQLAKMTPGNYQNTKINRKED